MKEKLLELINEYGDYQYESGKTVFENASESIGHFNSGEEVFNEILEIVDKVFDELTALRKKE